MPQWRKVFVGFIISLGISLGYGITTVAAPQNSVRAQDFLGTVWMQGPFHSVAPMATNNGQVNSYTVETRHGLHRINGTEQTRAFIREINTAENLRHKSTIGAASSAFGGRIVTLVKTPIDVVSAVGDRIDTVSSVGDAVLLAPRTTIDVGGKLLNGAGEMIYTGNRLIKSAGNSKCQGFSNCLSEAGEDIFSGINSIVGKHNAARRLHAEYGTDSETRNPILKREIDRLAYAQAYTKTGAKLFFPDIGVSEFDMYRRGVGFYENSETLAGYKDAFKPRHQQIDRLEARGVKPDVITAFYKNDNYTKKERVALIDSLERLHQTTNIGPFIAEAAKADTVYNAKSFVDRYGYIAELQSRRGIKGFAGRSAPIIMTPDGHHIVTLKADYLGWTNKAENAVTELSRLPKSEVHILGHASPDFKRRAQSKGVRVVEVR